MWLILSCLAGTNDCNIDLQRRHHWSADFALHSASSFYDTWSAEPDLNRHEEYAHQRFRTQRACLHALRRAMPEGETRTTYANSGRGWETANITHAPDYVTDFEAVGWVEGHANQMSTEFYGCFQEAPRVG